jgi:hypothetical protein
MSFPYGLGFDSFVACAAAGFVVPRWRSRIVWIVMFGAFDAMATLVAGLGWGSREVADLVIVTSVGLVAVPRFRTAWPAALPMLLCLDNLMDALRPVDAVPAGVISVAMATAGFVACSLACGCIAWCVALRRDGVPTPATPFE